MAKESLTAEEIVKRGLSGADLTVDEALALYANPKNWGRDYTANGCNWVWTGPTLPPYETAQRVLENRDVDPNEETKVITLGK